MTSAPDEKWRLFNCFSVQGTGGSPTGPDAENRVGDQDIGTQVGQFLLGCKCPLSRGIVVQEQDLRGDVPAALFLQNVLQLHLRHWKVGRVKDLSAPPHS